MITTDQIKELRDATGISVMQCKKALEEARGDMEKALIALRKASKNIADKKATRELKAGSVAAYVHTGGTIGVLLELTCETDFVAKNAEFGALAKNLAMHVAAAAPRFLKTEDITDEERHKAEEAFKPDVDAQAEGKSADIKKKIMEGKLAAYFKERTLLEQEYIRDPGKTVKDLVTEAIQKFGENIDIRRFARFSVLEK